MTSLRTALQVLFALLFIPTAALAADGVPVRGSRTTTFLESPPAGTTSQGFAIWPITATDSPTHFIGFFNGSDWVGNGGGGSSNLNGNGGVTWNYYFGQVGTLTAAARVFSADGMGYGIGTITNGTGTYANATGTIWMYWANGVCICVYVID